MAKRERGQAKRAKKGSGRQQLLLIAAFQLAAYAIAILSCAVMTLHSDAAPANDFYRMIGSLSVAAFCSSYAAARSRKRQGLLTGFFATLPAHLIMLLTAFLLGGFHADWTLPISFVILSLVSMLGGVLAVNRRETPQKSFANR